MNCTDVGFFPRGGEGKRKKEKMKVTGNDWFLSKRFFYYK